MKDLKELVTLYLTPVVYTYMGGAQEEEGQKSGAGAGFVTHLTDVRKKASKKAGWTLRSKPIENSAPAT